MFYIWITIIVLLVIVEALTVNLTTIWFVASGIVALIMSFFIEDFVVQFAVFTILGLFLIITTRPMIKKILKTSKTFTNLDRIIGTKGVVTEIIKKNLNGEVKVDGKKWTAYADKTIKVDSIVKILEINGTKIKVEKVEE